MSFSRPRPRPRAYSLSFAICISILLLQAAFSSVAAQPGPVVTVTVTAPSPVATNGPQPTCPVCFNCANTGCKNFGTCSNGACTCIDGFGGEDCSQPVCGSAVRPPELRSVRPANATCQCDDGFAGVNCNVCTRDDVCKGKPGAPAGKYICNRGVDVWKSTHSYCEVTEPLLKTVYPLDSYVTFDRDLVAKQAYGILWYTGQEQFYCKATDCSEKRTSQDSTYLCQNISCTCPATATFCGGPGSSIDLSGPVGGASGTVEYKCPRNQTSDCILNFAFLSGIFPTGIKMQNCLHGGCALASDDPGEIFDDSTAGVLTVGAIAGLAAIGSAALLLGACFAFACLRRAKARKQPVPPPRKGVDIRFDSLSYSVGKKAVLNDISGMARAGRTLAVMGPSGAGKSTLLDILAGKSKRGDLDGSLLVDGQRVSRSQYRHLIGYVDQEDLLMSTLTVRETLEFSARLRLPESMSVAERKARVEEVIGLLGLSHVADSRIGSTGQRGISGGEKRRVSIGVELVTSPAVLFLDEPTSGLDSYNAHATMQTICDLARKMGKTIIFTIHQPRSDVFAMFDDVLILSRGETMYYGSNTDVEKHLRTSGQPCPVGYNVADWLLDLAAKDTGNIREIHVKTHSSPSQCLRMRTRGARSPTLLSDHHTASDTFSLDKSQEDTYQEKDISSGVMLRASSDSFRRSGTLNRVEVENTPDASYTVGGLTQSYALLGRSFKSLIRQPVLWATHLGMALALGALVGGLYWKSDNTLGGIQNRLGSIFFVMSLLGFSGLSAIGAMTQERNLFIRERAGGFYGPLPFWFSKVIFDLVPLRIIPAAVMGTIAFYMVGYTSTGDHFARFLGVIVMFAANCGLFCMAVGFAIRDVGTANLVASITLLFQMLFAGFLLNQNQIPAPLKWIQYLSIFRYAYEALVVNDLSGTNIKDDISGLTVDVPASIVLDKFGFDRTAYFRDTIIVFAWFVGFLALLAILIIFRLRERR